MSDIDRIIATCRRDSRCVSGSERRALCDEIERIRAIVSDLRAQAARLARADCCEKAELLDEIERLRALAVRAWNSFRSTLPYPECETGLRNEDMEELVALSKREE